MKRLVIFFFVLSALGGIVKAQINLNDSIVQVVSYWSVGDKYEFKSNITKYKIVGTDTTVVFKSSMPFSIEVVDSTANNYVIKIMEGETQYDVMDEDTQMTIESGVTEVSKGHPLLLKMSSLGAVEDVENASECMEVLNKMADLTVEYMQKKFMADSTLTAEGRQAMLFTIKTVSDKLRSPQMLTAAVAPYMRLFAVFGKQYEMNKEYEATDQAETAFAPGQPIDFTSTFWVKNVYPEENSAVFANNVVYDSDQVLKAYLSICKEAIPEAEQYANSPDSPYIFLNEYTGWSIHVGSGWPLYYYQEIESRQGKEATISVTEIELIL